VELVLGMASPTSRIAVFNHSVNLLTLYRIALGQRGYEVMTFNHDFADFSDVEKANPDLLILGNVQGINHDEIDMLMRLRAHPQLNHIPVILSTTASENLLPMEKLQSAGNVHVLYKPFDVQNLLIAVKKALQSSQDQTESS
jgi:DNA-binding response OmpR family regulator